LLPPFFFEVPLSLRYLIKGVAVPAWAALSENRPFPKAALPHHYRLLSDCAGFTARMGFSDLLGFFIPASGFFDAH
jgi:hypothetical protein